MEKRKQRLLKREKDQLVISLRKLQSCYRFQTEVNWSCHNHPVLHKDMPTQYQQNPISNNLFIFQILFYNFLHLRKSCYRFFDTIHLKDSFQGVTVPQPMPKSDAKNCCKNPTTKVFTKSKSNKPPYLPEPSPEFACHCHTKILSLKCFSLLRLFRTLQKKWLSHTSE